MPELDEELKDKETENLQDIDNAGEAGKEDELLSDAEIKRIADMNLDDIIEDATSDSVSVEDLFGNGDSAAEASQENADEPVQAASQPEEKSDKASAEQAEAVQKQPDTTAAEAEQTETAGTQTEKSEPAEQAETQTQAEPGKEQEAAGSENQSDKKKKDKKAKKAKKDKKGFFSAVRDIFFESVEEEPEEENSAQFDVSDRRSLDEVVNWLLGLGYIPSFCTACYREGRTGDRFMKLLKSGQIVNCCQPNALMTLKEYLEDYASADTKEKGEKVIQEQLEIITNPVVKEKAKEYIENIHEGKRDFRF